MKSFLSILCLLSVFLVVCSAEAWNATNATASAAAGTHDVSITVVCGENITSVLLAVWTGAGTIPTAANISALVPNDNQTLLNSSTQQYYVHQNIGSVNESTLSLTQLTGILLKNDGTTYNFVAFCNASNGNASNPNFSNALTGNWSQPDSNGLNMWVDITYQGVVPATELPTWSKNQVQAVYSQFVAKGTVNPSQFIDANNVVANKSTRLLADANTTVIRTFILRDINVGTDQAPIILKSLMSNVTALIVILNAAFKDVTVTNVTSGNVSVPVISVFPAMTGYADASFSVSSADTSYFNAAVVPANYDDSSLTALDVIRGVDTKGYVFTNLVTGELNANNNRNTSLRFINLISNTVYKVFVAARNMPTAAPYSVSNLVKLNLTTATPVTPNTSNVTFTASAAAVVWDNIWANVRSKDVNVTVNCSQASLSAAFIAQFGNHAVSVSNPTDFQCKSGSTLTSLCMNSSSATDVNRTVFQFVVSGTMLRNLGVNYNLQAVCQNATVLSSYGSASWNQPDNGGKLIQLQVTYNGTFTANASNQSAAFAQLLTTVPSSLIVAPTESGSLPAYARTLTRNLAGNQTTVSTYVMRNEALASDNTFTLVNATLFNTVNVTQNLTAYYVSKNLTNMTQVVGVVFSQLQNPNLTLLVAATSSSEATVKVTTNVEANYVVVFSTTYNNSAHLNADDVWHSRDENSNNFTLGKNSSTPANTTTSITVPGLKAKTTYYFYAVAQDKSPAQQFSPIYGQVITTGASSFGERGLGLGLVMLIAIIGLLFN